VSAAPALVRPLLNRSIQIHRVRGAAAVEGHRPVPASDVGEVCKQSLGWRQPTAPSLLKLQRAVQESAWARRVDDEPCRNPDRTPVTYPFECCPVALTTHGVEKRRVQIDGAFCLGLSHQRMIEVGAIPVRIRNLVVRARRDQQLSSMPVVVFESPIEIMKEEGEPALQTDADVGMRLLP
jgi:hypothetical protein